MKSTFDPSDRPILEQLQKLGSATIQQLCEAMQVTQTAIRQRLNRLQAANLVDRHTIPADRGRPHHVYKVTQLGLQQLGDNYGELALVLWSELSKIDNPVVRNQLVESLKSSLVQRYGQNIDGLTPSIRLEQLKQVLQSRGFHVELDLNKELPILRENNCPYSELANTDKSICELEQAVFRDILKVDVNLTKCLVEGHHCCEFQLSQLETVS
jgi:predicted ArsR family transcriptional regulator